MGLVCSATLVLVELLCKATCQAMLHWLGCIREKSKVMPCWFKTIGLKNQVRKTAANQQILESWALCTTNSSSSSPYVRGRGHYPYTTHPQRFLGVFVEVGGGVGGPPLVEAPVTQWLILTATLFQFQMLSLVLDSSETIRLTTQTGL